MFVLHKMQLLRRRSWLLNAVQIYKACAAGRRACCWPNTVCNICAHVQVHSRMIGHIAACKETVLVKQICPVTHVRPAPEPEARFSDWLATKVRLPENRIVPDAGLKAASG